jgi:hypothetical protein
MWKTEWISQVESEVMRTVWKLVIFSGLAAGLTAGLAVTSLANAAEVDDVGDSQQAKTLSGMSVLGNNEAPKALVIVPWKSSQIGDGIGIVESLNNRAMPIDRDVFNRELDYYYIRANEPLPADFRPDELDFGAR